MKYYRKEIAMKRLIGDEQVHGPWSIPGRIAQAFPLLEGVYNPIMREDLTRAAHFGFLVNRTKGRTPFYEWSLNTLTPYVEFIPRRKTASFLLDLLPSCQRLTDEGMDALFDLLIQHKAKNSLLRVGDVATFLYDLKVDSIEIVGPQVVQIVQEFAEYKREERQWYEEHQAKLVA
jgi:hypothetical protein